ncbi:PLP-dependent aminotransferase family protein [Acidisphaera sp. S103]|uniref:aminotransferase-like domain-containing protein n=1 Tax=Acidisphaera sp. S103 TaxID=1747223 RepID=UPI00131AFB4E|nr:PLP-dependent aminotransferase family protein [Acidisphaera sp. S103]
MGIDSATLIEELAAAIASGELKPGDRLPPQRQFAYQRGIAASTASRIYAGLLRRGLVCGEVGRGTFVAAQPPAAISMNSEQRESRIDLEFNFPIAAGQAALMSGCLAAFQRADVLDAALRPMTTSRLENAQRVTAKFMGTDQWTPQPGSFLFTGSGRQSLASAIATLVPVGGRLGVEAVTYPLIKTISARHGVIPVPIAMDAEGIRPDAVDKAHRDGALSALYVQPVLHNPLGCSMSGARREDLLRLAEKLGIVVIEDRVYGFLADDPPLAARAPDHCIVVDSMSKRIAPGLALGFICAPSALRDRIAITMRASAWNVAGLALEIGMRLMSDGTAREIALRKRADAQLRQGIVAARLGSSAFQADGRSYHAWLHLPERWRSEAFVAAAARVSVAVTPSSAFTITPGHAPNAVRLALGLPSHEELETALTRLRHLLDGGPDSTDVTE